MPQVAACGRSEGSDGHMPLPKRGPHLRKRTPSRSGRGGRSPGAAGERALRPNVVASSTGPRSSTQSPHHAKNRKNRTDRACTDARPRLQPPVPYSRFLALSPPNSASPRWSTHPSQLRHQPTRHARPARCRRPAPGPPAPAWANPHHIYLARRGRGVRRESGGPPFLQAQAGSGKQAGAGRRPVALRAETHRTKQMERNTRRETRT